MMIYLAVNDDCQPLVRFYGGRVGIRLWAWIRLKRLARLLHFLKLYVFKVLVCQYFQWDLISGNSHTYSLVLAIADTSIYTNIWNFLKLPVFCVMSSMYCFVYELRHSYASYLDSSSTYLLEMQPNQLHGFIVCH